MSDLQFASARDKSVIPALLIAGLVLALIAAAVFWFNPHKVAELKVAGVRTFAPHTEVQGLAPAGSHNMRVIGEANSTPEDDLYVFATIHFTDKLRMPIYLAGIAAHATFADGTQADAQMIPASKLKRLEAIFPAITPLADKPINGDEQVAPQNTLTGTVILLFPGQTADAWAKKRNATLTLELQDQNPETTPLP